MTDGIVAIEHDDDESQLRPSESEPCSSMDADATMRTEQSMRDRTPPSDVEQSREGNSAASLSDWLVLPTLVFSQFAGTSLWFAPNAVITQVESFDESMVSTLVVCVQVGFILGTLALTLTRLADRVSPPLLFAASTLAGSALNLVCIATSSFGAWAALRLLVGVALAGVYPVGMKIAAMEYPTGLGARLGVLVGALTLGTAFPWLVRAIGDGSGLPFEATLGAVSALAAAGAVILAAVMVPRQREFRRSRRFCPCCFDDCDSVYTENDDDGAIEDALSKRSSPSQVPTSDDGSDGNGRGVSSRAANVRGWKAIKTMTASPSFRASAIGYFGHQASWELYTVWTYAPVLIDRYSETNGGVVPDNEALLSFLTIAIGAVSCTVAGVWSLRAGRGLLPGSAVVAMIHLSGSLICCLIAPSYRSMSKAGFLVYLLSWGWSVIADSAQFSSLTARYAHKDFLGSSLTLVTCLGYAITVASIQLIGALIGDGMDPGKALALWRLGQL